MHITTSFKILNVVLDYTLLNLENKWINLKM